MAINKPDNTEDEFDLIELENELFGLVTEPLIIKTY